MKRELAFIHGEPSPFPIRTNSGPSLCLQSRLSLLHNFCQDMQSPLHDACLKSASLPRQIYTPLTKPKKLSSQHVHLNNLFQVTILTKLLQFNCRGYYPNFEELTILKNAFSPVCMSSRASTLLQGFFLPPSDYQQPLKSSHSGVNNRWSSDHCSQIGTPHLSPTHYTHICCGKLPSSS